MTEEPHQEEEARRPIIIPDASTFEKIRQAYFAAKKQSGDEDDPHDATVRAALKNNGPSGALVPLEIRQSKLGGRGLFVVQTEPVPAGTPVYEATRYGIFRTESQWKRFLDLLPGEILRRDVVVWSYVLDWGSGLEVVAVDLDEGSLMNHGALDDDGDDDAAAVSESSSALGKTRERANIRYCNETGCYIAIRDIQPSDELLCDYASFHKYDHKLDWYDRTWNDIVAKGWDGFAEPIL